MTDAIVSRLGDLNQGGSDPLQLFLKKFSGEVLALYEQKTITKGKHLVRTIQSGKSAQFPAVGGITAEYHSPGTELTGLGVNHAENVITIDGLLVSHAFVAEIDDVMNHYDARSIYARQMGQTLANKYDVNILKEIVNGSRQRALVDDGDGGTTIENSDLGNSTDATKVQAFVDTLFAAAQALDEKNAPEERYCALAPADYYALVKTVQTNGFSVVNKDYGTQGSFADGNVIKIAGINILSTNNLPTTDTSGSDSYHGINASTTKGIVWCPEGAGTVKLMDLSAETEWDIRRQGWLMVAKMAVGHKYLRPECCVELRTGNPT
jgi:hypothetical protein